MALTIFLFKVSNIEIPKSKSEISVSTDEISTDFIQEEIPFLFCAKAIFRGHSLWSNNVPIQNGNANFLTREKKPKKFQFNLGTILVPEDKLRIEFYLVTKKKDKKKLVGLFDIILQSLIQLKYIDIKDESLSDVNNYLIKSTIDIKLYYTPPDLSREKAALDGIDDQETTVDWNATFDDEGRRGGHKRRHVTSKLDSEFTKFRRRLVRFPGDADTDSGSDREFTGELLDDDTTILMTEEEKAQANKHSLELLRKGLGRYEGDIYEMKEWQIMVHVIQGKDLPGLDINPYVCVQIDEQKRYTVVQRSTNSPNFSEFFTFDFTLPATQMMGKVIYFKVHTNQKFLSTFKHTKPIGIFKVDVSTVYNEKEHAFEKKWAQLSDPNSINLNCGHLLLSILVSERGVSSKNILGEISPNDEELKPSKSFIPSSMPRTLFPVQMKLTFFSACELPEMMTDFLSNVSKTLLRKDKWEPVDPYIEISYNALTATTEYQNGTTPVWGEAIYLIGQFPPLVRTIKLSLKDHAAIQQDRIISSFVIDLFSISESNPSAGFLPTFGPTWVFLYGNSREYTINKDQDGLSQGMGEAVCYKGRLLMEIDTHPINGEQASTNNIQKQSGIQLPESTRFPTKRTFVLFGCIYDVTMIDREFGNTTIFFELSIGTSGYLNPNQLLNLEKTTSITRIYPRIPIDNNTKHFRLPIDLQKPILFTSYTFHDYSYRMTISNRLKRASHHLSKLIRNFEIEIQNQSSEEDLNRLFRKIEEYIHQLPCGCEHNQSHNEQFEIIGIVHPTLSELLQMNNSNQRMNTLDEKRQKKLQISLDTLKNWISNEIEFNQRNSNEIIQQLNQIARTLKQLAIDIQPSLPDVFLWMICDSKRVAYARLSPEDLLFNICQGERGLYNGHVQTLFLQTPRTSDKPVKSSTSAKVQIFLWLGLEEQQENIFKQLPKGFHIPKLSLTIDHHYISYSSKIYYEIRCFCRRARSLNASDETGLSDPYLSITAGNETQITPILKESLCPQWSVALVFKNLMHVGTRETAEEIIGNVVVECYDYDADGDQSDLLGRFSTTAKLDLFNNEKSLKGAAFQWYRFQIGEKQAGQLLAVFHLVEVDPETRLAQTQIELEEIPLTLINFPPDIYIISSLKNKIYSIPQLILPTPKPYEIEVMFWGLRECRSINFQSIQQAQVTIDCNGEKIRKEIKDVQNAPNFESTSADADKFRLRINLPENKNFWPNLSILCIQYRLFGMKEVVGNLVVTDIAKFIQVSNQTQTPIKPKHRRIRGSIVDAYHASMSDKNQDLAKKKFEEFEQTAGEMVRTESNLPLVDEQIQNENSLDETVVHQHSTDIQLTLTNAEIFKQKQMEKTANWWNKYYASKAKLRLEKNVQNQGNETYLDNPKGFANYYQEEPTKKVKTHENLWKKVKVLFHHAENVKKQAMLKIEDFTDGNNEESEIDRSLENIEIDRLKELTLLQTFDIIETELEKVREYEGFTDCLDTFALYKGKGVSRSDEIGDQNRVYAKFKGKIRIRAIEDESTIETEEDVHPLLNFDLNRNPLTFKCRLYIIKALLFRSRDRSGKADPYIRICLNDKLIINDVESRIHNTLEPVFGKCYEFDVTIPRYSLLRIQVWDWDMINFNDPIAETAIDIENRWISSHRATCALPKRYDSAGYNSWRDTKKPSSILYDLCQSMNVDLPVYSTDLSSLTIRDQRFDCNPECIQFTKTTNLNEAIYRKAYHETFEEYVKQNTALNALHQWGQKINSEGCLVREHIECRSLYSRDQPDLEQGKLEMWLDIFPMSRPPSSAPIDITPPIAVAYQLRVIVWNTSDVELDDENFLTGEKSSDIYVKAWILGENDDGQQTDVHYRSLTGEGNFNWRFLFDFKYLEIEEKILHEKKDSVFQIGTTARKIPPRIVLRVYDADLISGDDFLGECILHLTHLPVGAKTSKACKADIVLNHAHKSVDLFSTKRAIGWWPMIPPPKPGEIRDVKLLGGKIEAEFSLVTGEEAEKNPVGKAREGPSPLDEPNRPKNSFLWFTSPWKTFRYVLWRNFKWPIILGIILFIFVIFLLLVLWSLPGAFITGITNKIFKTNGA